MDKITPDSPEYHVLAASVNAYLESSDATKLLEGKVVEFALERKAKEVFQQFLITRFLPSFAAVALMLGYLGWDVKGSIAKTADDLKLQTTALANTQQNLHQKHLEIQDRSKQLDDISARAEKMRSETEVRLESLTVKTESQMLAASDKLLNYAVKSTDRLARADGAIKAADVAASAAESRVESLRQKTVEQTNRANDLEAKLQLQATLVNLSVLEVVSLNDRTASNIIELPHLGRPPSKLAFTATTVTKSKGGSPYVDLLVHLDGVDLPLVRIEATPNGLWRRWRRLDPSASNYEYRVEHIYYDENANDFVSVQVRATKDFAESLMKSGITPR
ncbi:hypothetical protein [Kinneretia aquatilis]|nr:hypothetical protein [Paucibacter aquatile]